MVLRKRWQLDNMRRSCRAMVKHPSMIVKWGRGLAEVWCLDGKAVIFPGNGGCLVVDWYQFMRFIRRHRMV